MKYRRVVQANETAHAKAHKQHVLCRKQNPGAPAVPQAEGG